MEIVMLKIGDVHPYDKNPRKNDQSVEAVANSIREFGWQQPIVVDKNGEIICGHTRYKAAKKLGAVEVPCVIADNLSDEQIKAYRLADNKVSENAEWDLPLLSGELAGLTKALKRAQISGKNYDDAVSNWLKKNQKRYGYKYSFVPAKK